MASLKDFQHGKGRMFLFKGISGTGKTVAAGTFPEPIYFFEEDGRIAPLAYFEATKRRNIEYDSFLDWKQIDRKVEELIRRCDYRTVVFDSLTSLSRSTINTLFKNRGETIMDGKKKLPTQIGGIPVMNIQDYSGESSGIANIITGLRVLHNEWGCNVILAAHVVQSIQTTLEGKEIVTRRLLTGGNKIAAEIPSYFDEVYHFKTDSDPNTDRMRYLALTRGNEIEEAKTAINDMPSIINFTNESFYNIWKSFLPKDGEVKIQNGV